MKKAEAKGTEIAKRETKDLAQTNNGEVFDSVALVDALPPELATEFGNVLTEIAQGFGGTTAAGKIFERNEAGETFSMLDAYTTQMLNEKTGELEDKFVFILEMSAGDVVKVMQSAAGPREKYVRLYSIARVAGRGIRLEPMRYIKYAPRTRQPQDAFIFQHLPGWRPLPTDAPLLSASV